MDRSRHTVTNNSATRRHMQLFFSKLFKKLGRTIKFAKAHIVQRGPIIVGFFIFRTPNCECWRASPIFSTNFLTWANLKSWKWIQICCMVILLRKNWKDLSDLKWKQSGNDRGRKITVTVSLLMIPETSVLEGTVTSRKNETSENPRFSKEISDVQIFYASVVKRTVVMMLLRTWSNSLPKVWKRMY